MIFSENKFKDISIVLQGAISPGITRTCLLKLRSIFPEAELILSTWKNSETSDLNADKIVFSEDPGAVVVDKIAGTLNNVNRQIISTQAGIKAATRPYILKTRTDILFENADFLFYFGKYDDIPSPYFKNRLLICNYYTRNPRIFSACFHPSDWIVFGNGIDVKNYYKNIPTMTRKDETWFSYHSKKSNLFTNYICRFTPEQHIFLHFLKNHKKISCNCYYDCTQELIRETEKNFAQCFVVLNYQKQLPIIFSKYDPNRYFEKYTLISHWQWKALYRHYCQKQFSLLWIRYWLYIVVFKMLARLRIFFVLILKRLGLKEKVKNFLTKLKFHIE